MNFPFKINPKDKVIIIDIVLDDREELKMVLDTAASHTTIDSNALHILGYQLRNSLGTVVVETANGKIETQIFELNQFSALGIVKKDFPVQIYDFLAHGMFSSYDGMLGLDFFEGRKFCIDLNANVITL